MRLKWLSYKFRSLPQNSFFHIRRFLLWHKEWIMPPFLLMDSAIFINLLFHLRNGYMCDQKVYFYNVKISNNLFLLRTWLLVTERREDKWVVDCSSVRSPLCQLSFSQESSLEPVLGEKSAVESQLFSWENQRLKSCFSWWDSLHMCSEIFFTWKYYFDLLFWNDFRLTEKLQTL